MVVALSIAIALNQAGKELIGLKTLNIKFSCLKSC